MPNFASPQPQGVVRINQGAGSFLSLPIAGSGPGPGIAAGDLDGDGDTDCISGARVVRNTGGGTFSAAGQLPGGDPGRVTLADVDLDGDLDVVASHQWSANLGGLAFGPPEAFLGPAGPASVPTAGIPNRWWPLAPEVLDVDGDGDLDVMTRTGRLFSNTLRHLARGDLARPGRRASLEVFGPAGSPFILAASASAASIPLGPAGTLFLEPTAIAYATTGVLGPSGTAAFSVAVPPIAALVGGTLYWQAWIATAGRLTNLEPVTIVNP